jgi:hypothetical protein
MENLITSLLILTSFMTAIILPLVFAIKDIVSSKKEDYAVDDTFFMRR